jgi:hypothetical protein
VASVRLGATGTGRCSVRLLPAGTAVSLRYFFAGKWSTLASGRTKTTAAIPFSFRFPRRGTYLVRVIVGKSRVYAATASRLMKVVVR